MDASTKEPHTKGQRLKEFRVSMNLSQEDLANKLNVGRLMISNYERGVHELSDKSAIKLYQEFPNLNKNWLEYGKGPMLHRLKELTANEPKGQYGKVMVDISDVLIGYFKEIDLIKDLLVNKQDSYRSAVESLIKK